MKFTAEQIGHIRRGVMGIPMLKYVLSKIEGKEGSDFSKNTITIFIAPELQ
jgi:hypothetical protein